MSVKQIEVDSIGMVSMYKRKGAKNIRLSIAHNGDIRLTLPMWAPYSAGVDFLKQHIDWIQEQRPIEKMIIQGHPVGKAHHIHFDRSSGDSVTTRLTSNQVRILLPIGMRSDHAEAQKAARSAAVRALKKEATRLLPQRTKLLAQNFGYSYQSITIKQLKGRWGSCSDKQELTFNCYLMQLPWELIDYVILHELAHTKVMAHGPIFWEEMARTIPHVQRIRKTIKQHKPTL